VILILAALAGVTLAAMARYRGKAPVKLPPENCDAALWRRVYLPDRLKVIEACTAVEGRVVSVERASDGDVHIALDPDQPSVLNLMNATHSRGHLVVEIICEHPPSGDAAKAACAGFTQTVTVPHVGDRIRVTGAYVTDRENHWNEVHPVTRIEILR